jgi:Domain of unknown function (DUF6457)
MSILEQWTAAVSGRLGLDPGPLSTADTKVVLDLARDAAHAVDRPAAPLTAYLPGRGRRSGPAGRVGPGPRAGRGLARLL